MDLGSTFKELVDEVNKKTVVVANSSEATTATLSKVKVGNTNYAVPSGGGGSVTVDSALSATSTNPVQNKIITNEINSINILLQSHDDTIRALDSDYQRKYDWITPTSNLTTVATTGTHTIDISTFISGWASTHVYEVVLVVEAYCANTAYMSTFTDLFSNEYADQRFSGNGRQGGGIYTLPVKRYIKYTISSANLNTLKMSIVKARRIS